MQYAELLQIVSQDADKIMVYGSGLVDPSYAILRDVTADNIIIGDTELARLPATAWPQSLPQNCSVFANAPKYCEMLSRFNGRHIDPVLSGSTLDLSLTPSWFDPSHSTEIWKGFSISQKEFIPADFSDEKGVDFIDLISRAV